MSNILVLGDKLVDRYVLVEPKKVSAEAPIVVGDVIETKELPGGADNVRALLVQLGHTSKLISGWNVEGIDPAKPHLRKRVWPTKTRVMAGDYQLTRYDEHDQIGAACACEYNKELPKQIGDKPAWDALVVADYAKGSITPEVIKRVAMFQVTRSLYVHTKSDPVEWLAARPSPPPIMFCNEEEYARHMDTYDLFELVVRTLGSAGAELVRFGESIDWVPSAAAAVVSVNGAGDALLTGFVHGHLAGNSPQRSLVMGSEAAAITIAKPFCGELSLEELNERMQKHATNASDPS